MVTTEHGRKIRAGQLRGGKKMGRKRVLPDTICTRCGTGFRPHQHGQRRSSRFCSIACRDAAMGEGNIHPNWKGGVFVSKGYRWVFLPREEREKHTCARRAGVYIKEHQMVAEKALGRCLKPSECVHHLNMNKLDNRNSNLLVCTRSYHSALHQRMSLAWAREHMKG